MVKLFMGLMIILIGVEMTSSTSIHLALDIIKGWEAKNTGDYVKSSVINHAILPGINVIGQHVQTIEKEQEMLSTWIRGLAAVFGVTIGIGIIIMLIKKIPRGSQTAGANE